MNTWPGGDDDMQICEMFVNFQSQGNINTKVKYLNALKLQTYK